MKEIEYNFAKEFTKEPGPRYRNLGEKSGEEFREDVLKPLLKEYDFINIDGTDIASSFNPSFLSEAFGKLADELGGRDNLLKRIRLYSNKNPKLEEKFIQYLNAENKK